MTGVRSSKKKPKRVVVSVDDDRDDTPISRLINFGPVTLPEFESMKFKTLGDLRNEGWEAVCRKWVDSYPERLNVNAFIGVIATLEGIAWTRITVSQRMMAKNLVNQIKAELGIKIPKAKKSKRS